MFLLNGSCPSLSQYLGLHKALQICQLRSFKPIGQAEVIDKQIAIWKIKQIAFAVFITRLSQLRAEDSEKAIRRMYILYIFRIQPWEHG